MVQKRSRKTFINRIHRGRHYCVNTISFYRSQYAQVLQNMICICNIYYMHVYHILFNWFLHLCTLFFLMETTLSGWSAVKLFSNDTYFETVCLKVALSPIVELSLHSDFFGDNEMLEVHRRFHWNVGEVIARRPISASILISFSTFPLLYFQLYYTVYTPFHIPSSLATDLHIDIKKLNHR